MPRPWDVLFSFFSKIRFLPQKAKELLNALEVSEGKELLNTSTRRLRAGSSPPKKRCTSIVACVCVTALRIKFSKFSSDGGGCRPCYDCLIVILFFLPCFSYFPPLLG